MGQTADEIKQQIEQQREQLGSNLEHLEAKVKETVDWRSQFEQRPMAGVGLAFGAGFLLSMLIPSGDDNKERSSDYRYDPSNYRVYDEASRTQSSTSKPSYQPQSNTQQSRQRSPEMNEVSETVENIRGAVMGMAATRLRSFLAESVPGFQDEYEQARKKRGASDASKIDTELNTSAGTRTSDAPQSSAGNSDSSSERNPSSGYASASTP